MGKQLNVRGLLYHAIEGANRDAIEHEFGHELPSVARECSGQTSVQSSLFRDRDCMIKQTEDSIAYPKIFARIPVVLFHNSRTYGTLCISIAISREFIKKLLISLIQ